MYRKTKNEQGGVNTTQILRLTDNAFIPFDPANTDYQEYLRWLEEGNEPLTLGEAPLTWNDIRAKRDQLILASDWTMTPGATVDQAQWASYRQILRDLPQTFASTGPESVVWPQQPTAVGPNTKEVKEAAVKIDEEQA
jgi:hypothetical protein